MKWILALAAIAAAAALALAIGQRLSTDAMAIALGVIFGVAASIPTSLLIFAATRHQPGPSYQPPEHPPQPHLVIMPGPNTHANTHTNTQQHLPQPPHDPFQPHHSRRFKVVGEQEHWLDDDF